MSDIIVTDNELPEVPGLRLSQITIPSTLDGNPQPVIIGVPERPCTEPTPLLVGLHTWSADFRQQTKNMGPLCAEYGWLMILPNFRGPNLTSNPDARLAGGSLAAQRDIVDAVAHMRAEYAVDEQRIYLIGGSGGGHMSLMMAGKHPEIWAGVSSWCPITSLAEWYAQGHSYAQHVEAVCGGAPGMSAEVDFEYERRSPRTFITNAAHTPVRISHGDKDHCIMPVQTWTTYARLMDMPHRTEFYSWTGGHHIILEDGFGWLSQQTKPTEPPQRLEIVTDEPKWTFWAYLEPDGPLALAKCQAQWLEDGALEVAVEHSQLTRIALGDRPAERLVSVERDGQHTEQPAVTLSDGLLQLPPCAERTCWRIILE